MRRQWLGQFRTRRKGNHLSFPFGYARFYNCLGLCSIRFYISFSSTLTKAKTHQFTQLENKIQSLQNLQKQHFTEQQATQLSSLKEEYDLLSHSKAEFILHRTRQKYYFESEASHLLALRLKECESKAYISTIKSSDDQVTTNPVAINYIFKGFYTNLYKAETDFDEPICKQYLDKLELPRISQIDKESLEAPLHLHFTFSHLADAFIQSDLQLGNT